MAGGSPLALEQLCAAANRLGWFRSMAGGSPLALERGTQR